MRSVYIESCSLFVRGGVYRVVKEAMGGFLAKLSVSALLFDYVLTGPISGVSAGQYIVGSDPRNVHRASPACNIARCGARRRSSNWGSVAIACLATLYFLRQNLLGIHESSGKALKIMIATTVMAVDHARLVGRDAWSIVRFIPIRQHPMNPVPSWQPDLSKKWDVDAEQHVPEINPITREQEDPLGWLGHYP